MICHHSPRLALFGFVAFLLCLQFVSFETKSTKYVITSTTVHNMTAEQQFVIYQKLLEEHDEDIFPLGEDEEGDDDLALQQEMFVREDLETNAAVTNRIVVPTEQNQTQEHLLSTTLALKMAPTNTSLHVPSETNASTSSTKANPLNILILYPDDWRHDSIGGVAPVVQTPFLNELAREGIRFSHNCVTTSICWISRATLFTGQYAARHKSYLLKTPEFHYKSFIQRHTAWPVLLRDHGYFTGHVGKWQYKNKDVKHPVESFFNWTKLYEGKHWFVKRNQTTGAEHPYHATDKTKDDAIQFLSQRPKDRPFALTVAFFPPKALKTSASEPGVQWQPKRTTEAKLFVDSDSNEKSNTTNSKKYNIPMPPDTFDKLPYFFKTHELVGRERYIQRFNHSAKYQVSMLQYYRLIYDVDQACKGIIDKLKEQGDYDNTLIIFTTDNGYSLGEHGLAGKWYPFQESIRVPLIIRDPRMPLEKRNTVDDSFTLNLDLAETVLGAAQVVPPPFVMQGRDIADLYLPNRITSTINSSFHQSSSSSSPAAAAAAAAADKTTPRYNFSDPRASLTQNPTAPWREEFYYEWPIDNGKRSPMASALVRKEYKYIYWPEFKYEQLFHLVSDPMEEHDLLLQGGTPKSTNPYADLVKEMRQRHDELAILVK